MNRKYITKPSHATDRPIQHDWSAFDACTDEEIAEDVRGDPDVAPILTPAWLDQAKLIRPPEKVAISIRIDKDVLEHFRSQPRYQTRINSILRVVMAADKSKDGD
jgi:uncharacterized protein (DUF4415 family)